MNKIDEYNKLIWDIHYSTHIGSTTTLLKNQPKQTSLFGTFTQQIKKTSQATISPPIQMHQDTIFSTPNSSKAISYYQIRKLQQLIATSSSPKWEQEWVKARWKDEKCEEIIW